MLEALLGFASVYMGLMLFSTTVSLGSLAVLGFSGERSYNVRTTLLMLPLAGGVIGELWQGIPCWIHHSLSETFEHLLCGSVPLSAVQASCLGWVVAIGVSLSITGIAWGLSHRFSDGVMRMVYGFRPLGEEGAGDWVERLEDLSRRAGIGTPSLSLIESSKPIIFSVGRGERATVYMSVGLLETLSGEEVTAALAHEVAHCKNHDSDLKSILASLRYSSIFNPLGLLLAPAVSREREFLADADAASLIGGSRHLISALVKLSSPFEAEQGGGRMDSLISLSGLGRIRWMISNKHPSLEERVSRLQRL